MPRDSNLLQVQALSTVLLPDQVPPAVSSMALPRHWNISTNFHASARCDPKASTSGNVTVNVRSLEPTFCLNSNNGGDNHVPGDFVGPGSFRTSTSAYDYNMVTSAVTIESPVTCAVNIERLEADKWIVVRGKKNGYKTSYLLEPD
jgi:hypothetical protein